MSFNLNYPYWFSNYLKKLIKEKNNAHYLFKNTMLPSDFFIFSDLRAKCKYIRERDFSNFIKYSQNSIKTNPKQFWTFLKHKKLNHDLPNYMRLNDTSANNGQTLLISLVNIFPVFTQHKIILYLLPQNIFLNYLQV